MPFDFVAGVLQILGLDLVNAIRLIGWMVLAAGLVGCRRLFARFTPIGWIAWVGAFAFLVAPIVSLQAGYGPMQWGFVLLPGCILLDLRLLEAVTRARIQLSVVAVRIVVVVLVRLVALTLDPYSFVIGMVAICLLYLASAIHLMRVHRPARIALIAGVLAVSTGVANLIYRRLAPVEDLPTMPLSFFRGQGVDLVPQLIPSKDQWWAQVLGLHHDIQSAQAYSDGQNISVVFLGYATLALALLGCCVALRSPRRRADRRVFIIVAVVCTALALGPSWKFNDFRAVAPGARLTFGTYLMADSEAPNTMPWTWIFTHLPGVSQMRALYRWELGVRLALIVLAVMALTWLARRAGWSHLVAVVAAVLLLIDVAPDLPRQFHATHENLSSVRGLEVDMIAPLGTAIRSGERGLLYGPGQASPGTNDYLANVICPSIRLVCYDIGGDKALLDAAKSYPPDAVAVLNKRGGITDRQAEQHLSALMTTGRVDVVVLVHFDMTLQAYHWPATAQAREAAVTAELQMFTGPEFTKDVHPWFTVVRLAGPAG